MSIIKMTLADTGTAGAVAIVDIPSNGKIKTIAMGLNIEDTSPVTGEGASAELSFVATSSFTTHDTRGSLCMVTQQPFFVDAARIVMAGTPFCVLTPIEIKVEAGERLFLHGLGEGASVTYRVNAYIFIDDAFEGSPRSQRRR